MRKTYILKLQRADERNQRIKQMPTYSAFMD